VTGGGQGRQGQEAGKERARQRVLRCQPSRLARLVHLAGVLIATCAVGAPTPATARTLRGGDALVKVYDAILDADFDRAERLTADACPPAPEEACRVLEATRLLWQIQLDPEQMRLDGAFLERVNRAIEDAEAWTERTPNDPEAWFYLGGAYGARVQWRVLRHQTLSAARDGKRIKEALDEALRLDPMLDDAQFGLGLYEYYADVAPTAAKMLRWLLLLPGGDRVVGLQRMQTARTRGTLLPDEAAYQLHLIDLWYEHKPQEALTLLRQLVADHPTNPLFLRLIGDVQDTYLHDRAAALETYRQLLDRARAGRVAAAEQAEVEARLGIARQLDAIGDTDLAIDELTKVLALDPIAPYGAAAEAKLALAAASDRIGARDQAERWYREVIASPPVPDPSGAVARARRGLSKRPDLNLARAYGLSLDAWRQFERGGSPVDAEVRFERALTMDPKNTIARYRYARVLMARRQETQALTELDQVLGASAATPPTIVAEAALAAATLHERARDRDRAIDLYTRASTIFGAASTTRAAAERALRRLQH
jgi:tetratricopeptide (TPR) repeat protein